MLQFFQHKENKPTKLRRHESRIKQLQRFIRRWRGRRPKRFEEFERNLYQVVFRELLSKVGLLGEIRGRDAEAGAKRAAAAESASNEINFFPTTNANHKYKYTNTDGICNPLNKFLSKNKHK